MQSGGANGRWYALLASGFFLIPFALIAATDYAILGRTGLHHLGDYSGLYSLGVGWLQGEPYVNFAWPLWSAGQISTLFVMFLGYPLTDLTAFYHAWASLNVAAACVAAWLTSQIIADTGLPAWSALGFGSIAATMPSLTMAWNNSNPYFVFGMLLVPGCVVLARRLSGTVSDVELRAYEWTALVGVGLVVANNFGAAIVPMAGAMAALGANPGALTKRELHGVEQVPAQMRLAFSVGTAVCIVSLCLAVPHRLSSVILNHQYVAFPIIVAITWVVYQSTRRIGFPPTFIVRPVVAVMLGWLIGVNILALHYGSAARIAASINSTPGGFSLNAFLPEVAWTSLGSGAHWFDFILMAYIVGLILLLLSLNARPNSKTPLLRAAGIFTLALIYGNVFTTGWDLNFPVAHNPEKFGIDFRYLWLGAPAAAVAFFGALTAFRRESAQTLLITGFCALGFAALAQSIEAKRVVIANIDRVLAGTDRAIDSHLAHSERNIVLIANAYYPMRAQVLYAHHNTATRVPFGAVDSLAAGRIRYIGRYGGSMWRSPTEIAKAEGLAPENILIIAECAEYPAPIVITQEFVGTSTGIARIAPSNVAGENASSGCR